MHLRRTRLAQHLTDDAQRRAREDGPVHHDDLFALQILAGQLQMVANQPRPPLHVREAERPVIGPV